MSRSLSGLSNNNVYVNSMFASGTAIDIQQTSNNTQAKVNLDISSITNTQTTSASNDIYVLETNTGSIKKITHSNLIDGGSAQIQTLKNKTMELPFSIFDTTKDHKYVFDVSELIADRTITLPLLTGNDEFVFKDHTQTLTNKTLTTPIISSISNTGTLTLPTSTDTLVGRATTDTLTNKTLTTPIISSISNTGTITLPTSTDTLVGRATTDTLTNKTISTGSSYQGGVIAYNYGGTAQSSYTKGDILYASADNTLAKLPIGSVNQVLNVFNGVPVWSSNITGNQVEIRAEITDSSTRLDCFGLNCKYWTGSAVSDYNDIIQVLNARASGSLDYPRLKLKLNNTNGAGYYLRSDNNGFCEWTTSFSFIDDKFYNTSRTIYLDHNSDGYGYVQRGMSTADVDVVWSDFHTKTTSSGTKISSIGSYTGCRFSLMAEDISYLCIDPLERGWITVGNGLADDIALTPLAQLHIENTVSNMDTGDTQILIKSNSSSYDASILFSVNENSDGSGSQYESEVYGTGSGDLNLRGDELKILNTSATEYVRFTRDLTILIDNELLVGHTPTKTRTNFTNTSVTTLRLQGGNSTSPSTSWGSVTGEYQILTVMPPTLSSGPWSLFVEDYGTSLSYLGWFYGQSLQTYLTNSGSLYSRTTWSQSDSRIKTNISSEGVNQKCYDIVKRIKAKEYNYKQELINSTEDYTDKKVYGWLADDFHNDDEVNYLSTVEQKPREYYNDNKELLLQVKDCLNIRKGDIGSITWGCCGRLIEIVEEQQEIINKLISSASFKAFKEKL